MSQLSSTAVMNPIIACSTPQEKVRPCIARSMKAQRKQFKLQQRMGNLANQQLRNYLTFVCVSSLPNVGMGGRSRSRGGGRKAGLAPGCHGETGSKGLIQAALRSLEIWMDLTLVGLLENSKNLDFPLRTGARMLMELAQDARFMDEVLAGPQ